MAARSVAVLLVVAVGVALVGSCLGSGLVDHPIAADSVTYLDGADWQASTRIPSGPVTCTFKTNIDFDNGQGGPSSPAKDENDCCQQCGQRADCAAAVLHEGTCWFKTAEQVQNPSTQPNRTACIVQHNNFKNVSIKATVPGDIITDLEKAGMIPDPLTDLNWLNSSLWGSNDWTYTKTFSAARPTADGSDVVLVFDGIKMGATIKLNGHVLGQALSQFLRYEFSVGNVLSADGTNVLEVVFSHSIDVQGRFMACSGGWDWAPYSNTYDQHNAHTLSYGIWKNVYLATVSSAAIDHVVPQVVYTGAYPTSPMASPGGPFEVHTTVFLKSPNGAEGTVEVAGDWTSGTPSASASAKVSAGWVDTAVQVKLTAPSVNLWWPNGFGNQDMYNITVTFTPSGGSAVKTTRRIGFRFAVLVTINDTDPNVVKAAETQEGSGDHTMMFRVNGAPMLVLGANLIPLDQFDGRASADAHYMHVRSAAEAHYTMLRHWGGGIFQYDIVFDAMDEFGILGYQDLMYAQQGHSPAVTATQDAEIRHQVRRLSAHPSIIMWDGCNECGGAGIYTDFAVTTVAQEDQSRVVWSSCPSVGWTAGVHRLTGMPNGNKLVLGGKIVETHGYYQHGATELPGFKPVNGGSGGLYNPMILPDPANNADPFKAVGLQYPGKFASEFGSCGPSSFESMSATLSPSNWGVHTNAPVWEQRNYAVDNLIVVNWGWSSLNGTGEYALKRQMMQAMISQGLFVQSDVMARRASNTFGMMTWQIGENWPTGGWGSLEYASPVKGQSLGGRWKPLHHMMKQCMFTLQTAAVTANYSAYVRNDGPRPFSGTLTITVVDLQTGATSTATKQAVNLPAGAAAIEWIPNAIPDSLDPHTKAVVTQVHDAAGALISDYTQLLATPGNLSLPKASPTFTFASAANADGSVNVTLHTDKPAVFVGLTTASSGFFSDNWVLLLPSAPRVVSFVPYGPLDMNQLRSTTRLEHVQMYQ